MDKEQYLKENGVILPEQRTLPVAFSGGVNEMREQLEIKKLQIELDKLEKPDTSIDYYSKMLELQQQHFNQLLEMQKQQTGLQLEIEKLKLAEVSDGDDFLPLIKGLLPYLPEIIKARNQTPQVNTKSDDVEKSKTAGESPAGVSNSQKGGDDVEITKETTAGELQEYVEAIKKGEISYEEAYEDFKNSPYADMLTDEQFKAKFEAIKKTQGI